MYRSLEESLRDPKIGKEQRSIIMGKLENLATYYDILKDYVYQTLRASRRSFTKK